MTYFSASPFWFITLSSLLGLIIGSFLNVIIVRLPKMMENQWRQELRDCFPDQVPESQAAPLSLSLPRSHCPHCHSALRVRDNIPILSFLCLRGRCASCHTKISWRYPLVEAFSAVLTLVIMLKYDWTPLAFAYCGVVYSLLVLALIDWDTFLLPDSITLPLMWAGLLAAYTGISPVPLEQALLGTMAGYLVLWTLYWAFKLITGKEGLGYGDFKLLAALGAWVGSLYLLPILLIASFAGLFLALILLRKHQGNTQQPMPFGPSLALAGTLILLWGDEIVSAYTHFIFGYSL